jgi:hypothetical protein
MIREATVAMLISDKEDIKMRLLAIKNLPELEMLPRQSSQVMKSREI